MKLHWSVKRGGIIVKTYKEHLLTLQTQINTIIPRTDVISTINAVTQFLQMCRNILITFLSWAYMNTSLFFLFLFSFRQTCDSNKSVQTWREVILTHIFVQITCRQGREIHELIFWGREFQRDAPAKDMLVLNNWVKPWPWHVKVIFFELV